MLLYLLLTTDCKLFLRWKKHQHELLTEKKNPCAVLLPHFATVVNSDKYFGIIKGNT